jgi:hypothetical protein
MSLPSKRPRFLQPSEISELFLDTDSGEATDSSDVSSFGSSEGVPGVSHFQPYSRIASRQESSSSISSSASDEEETVESGPGEQIQQAVTLQWTRPSFPQSSVAHTYTGGPSPLSVFLLYFAEIIALLVVETNRYYHDYIVLTKDPLLNLTSLKPKCMCFWHWQYRWDMA